MFLHVTARASTRFIDKPDAKTADLEKHQSSGTTVCSLARLKPLFPLRRASPHATSTRIPRERNETNRKRCNFNTPLPPLVTIAAARTTCVVRRIKSIESVNPFALRCASLDGWITSRKKTPDARAYHVETKSIETIRIFLNPTRRPSSSFHARRARVCGSVRAQTVGCVVGSSVNCFYMDILWWRPRVRISFMQKMMDASTSARSQRQTRARATRGVSGHRRGTTRLPFALLCFTLLCVRGQ